MDGEESLPKKRKLPGFMKVYNQDLQRITIWIRGEDDVNPVKIVVTNDADVADLLSAAATCGEFNFLINDTKSYNIIFGDQILARDDYVRNYDTSANKPFLIVKIQKQTKNSHRINSFQISPSGKHQKELIRDLIEGILDYNDFILSVKKSSKLLELPEIPDRIVKLEKVEIDSNELSLTAKLTTLLALTFEETNLYITPFFNLEVPENKRGHPYMADLLVTSTHEKEHTRNAIAIKHEKHLKMLIEVKKIVTSDLVMMDPSHLIEMLLYVKYMMKLWKQNMLLGAITDGIVIHCFDFRIGITEKLLVKGCAYVKGKDAKTITALPTILSHFGYLESS